MFPTIIRTVLLPGTRVQKTVVTVFTLMINFLTHHLLKGVLLRILIRLITVLYPKEHLHTTTERTYFRFLKITTLKRIGEKLQLQTFQHLLMLKVLTTVIILIIELESITFVFN